MDTKTDTDVIKAYPKTREKEKVLGKQIRKKPPQIEIEDKCDVTSSSSDCHNDTYCRNWVHDNAAETGKNAQSDSESRSTFSFENTVTNVTSVSRNVAYKNNQKKLPSHVKSTVQQSKTECTM